MSTFSFFLIVVLVFSFSSYAFAETNIFTGIEAIEVEENQVIDLLQGVSATSPLGEILQVTVDNVTCKTDEQYIYDGSGILNSGKAGSEYVIEYRAKSLDQQEKDYCGLRIIQTISKESTQKKSEILGIPIIYENGIHYIEDPNYPGEHLTLFCMNSELHWPHLTPDMGETQVPGYTEGYLKPSDFRTEEDYRNCMRQLAKLLYAGYPHNAEHLYQIVTNPTFSTPTEEEFNKMLIVPPVLQLDFPYLAEHTYMYSDWKENHSIHLGELKKFVNEVVRLGIDHTTTKNGLTYEDIESMLFYKAAFSMTYGQTQDPLIVFSNIYGAKYYVTEEQAYNATQEAIWYLLYQYGVADNNLSTMSLELSNILYTYSERGEVLDKEPSIKELQFSEEVRFTYNPTDKRWHSTPLCIEEPEVYKGIYHLKLPKGMSILDHKADHIYGNKKYELVCDHQPVETQELEINAEFIWLKEIKQYSPIPDIEVVGKKFQRMVGAVIRTKKLSKNIKLNCEAIGGLSIEKQVVGEENAEKEFQFELQFPNNPTIDGVYGDLDIHDGIAKFALKSGQRVTATNLPAGVEYKVTELETGEYKVQSTNDCGTIVANKMNQVVFINSKCHDLSLGKIVKGELGDQTKPFTFVVQIAYQKGNPINGTYHYTGGVIEGMEQEVQKPVDGTISFQNGVAEVSLSHGQKITINHLPPNIHYVVTEKEENQDHYITTYNGNRNKAEGMLDKDTVITVVNRKEVTPDTGVKVDRFGSSAVTVFGILGLIAICYFKLCRRKGRE